MRLFIAIQFDQPLLDTLVHFQGELRKTGVIGKYTKEENLHLTLAFIGEYGDPDAVMDALEQVSFQPFELRLDGVGSFGEIFWVGVSGEDALNTLAGRVRRALSEAGIPFDRKKFRPHITLIRKASYKSDQRIPVEEVTRGSMTVQRISLMKSERGKNGMVYTEFGSVEAE